MLQIGQQLKQQQSQEVLHNMNIYFVIIFFLLIGKADALAQQTVCNTYEIIKDSIGEPFVKEALFLREVGMKQNNKDVGLPSDRLLQYPFFILYSDSVNLFKNYEGDFFAFIDAFSPMKDSLNNRRIFFDDGIKLNSKFSLMKSSDTVCQSVKFAKKGNYKNVRKLFFEYEVYKMKLQVVYIGKYCRKVPDKFIQKGKPMFISKPLDVYIILDIIQ